MWVGYFLHSVLQYLFYSFPEIMASAAGLLSPGLVSLVRRAQQVRLEMDQNSATGKTKVA